MNSKQYGAFPTMITPYNDRGEVDYEAVEKLVHWYHLQGCAGIFASCQSSEIWYLPEEDRVKLAQVVVQTARPLGMTVVASGHVSDRFEDQVRELTRVAETGVDAVILITNRLDIANTGDDAWIADGERLLAALPSETMLGLYECPYPYKRLLTPAMIRWCLGTNRFRFIKDTCCDAEEIARRLALLEGSNLALYNANAQTLLPSLRAGGSGYCGVMSNFHPQLYNWLVEHFLDQPELAERVAALCSMTAFTESLAYPITAKYHLSRLENIPMSLTARSRKAEDFTPYHAMCVEQMNTLVRGVMEELNALDELEGI